VNCALNVKPSLPKKSTDLLRYITGRIDEDLLVHVLSFEIVRTPIPTITSTVKGQIDTTTIIFRRVGQDRK